MNHPNDAHGFNGNHTQSLSNDDYLESPQHPGSLESGCVAVDTLCGGKGFGTNRAGNTRLNSQSGASDPIPLLSLMTVKIDGLRFVIPIQNQSDVDQMIDDIERTFSDKESLKQTDIVFINGRVFANRATTTRGGAFCWNLPGQNNDDGSLLVSVTGTMLSQCTERQKYDLIVRILNQCNGHLTRLDVALDDWLRFDPFDHIRAAVADGNYAGFREIHDHEKVKSGKRDGRTIYLGSTDSDSFLRVYDKNAESKGEIASTRWELQAKHEKAQLIATHLSALVVADTDDDSIAQILANFVIGKVRFIEKKDKNLSRCSLLSWWKEFISRVGDGIRLAVPKPVTTIKRKVKWFGKTVSTSMMQMHKILGITEFYKFIRHMVENGDAKAQKHHYSFVDIAKEELKKASWESLLN